MNGDACLHPQNPPATFGLIRCASSNVKTCVPCTQLGTIFWRYQFHHVIFCWQDILFWVGGCNFRVQYVPGIYLYIWRERKYIYIYIYIYIYSSTPEILNTLGIWGIHSVFPESRRIPRVSPQTRGIPRVSKLRVYIYIIYIIYLYWV